MHLVYLSIRQLRYLGGYHFVTTTNDATVNTHIEVSKWMYIQFSLGVKTLGHITGFNAPRKS